MKVINKAPFAVIAHCWEMEVDYGDDVRIEPGESAEVPRPRHCCGCGESENTIFNNTVICHDGPNNADEHIFHISAGKQLCVSSTEGEREAGLDVRHHSEEREIQKVFMIDGKFFYVDTTSCGRFGFEYRQRIRCINDGRKGTVMGVACLPRSYHVPCSSPDTELLWVLFDGEDGVSFSPNPTEVFEKI